MKTGNLSRSDILKFRNTIWDFYKKHGRSMPWRGERDPFKVLVSEIMLQQTQVFRVIPKYNQFIKTFPNIGTLAKAPLSDVLTHWSGLGYNRRALFLQKMAREVVLKHKGVLPQEIEQLILLPGIGKATAGSISAFAFNKPVVFVETNIRRVFIHFFFPNKKKVSDKEIMVLVEKTLDRKNPRLWYYALMDYGAMLKETIANPNKRSLHYTKQSKFTGSNREIRGAIIKYITKYKKASIKKFIQQLSFDRERLDVALVGLMREGMIAKKKGVYIIQNDI